MPRKRLFLSIILRLILVLGIWAFIDFAVCPERRLMQRDPYGGVCAYEQGFKSIYDFLFIMFLLPIVPQVLLLRRGYAKHRSYLILSMRSRFAVIADKSYPAKESAYLWVIILLELLGILGFFVLMTTSFLFGIPIQEVKITFTYTDVSHWIALLFMLLLPTIFLLPTFRAARKLLQSLNSKKYLP